LEYGATKNVVKKPSEDLTAASSRARSSSRADGCAGGAGGLGGDSTVVGSIVLYASRGRAPAARTTA
jgi:hypothetical protein